VVSTAKAYKRTRPMVSNIILRERIFDIRLSASLAVN
jgi:hypothetical protein